MRSKNTKKPTRETTRGKTKSEKENLTEEEMNCDEQQQKQTLRITEEITT
jgi:hypothetical protein